jgi:hypothetical protein
MIASLLGWALTATSISMFALMLLSFPLGGYFVYDGAANVSIIHAPREQIPFFIFGVPLGAVPNFSNGISFFLVWVIYLIFLISSLKGPRHDFRTALKSLRTGNIKAVFENTALTFTFLFGVLWSATSILQSLQERVGIQTGDLPEREPLDQLVSISISPLTEEFGFRLTLIGFLSLFWVSSRMSFRDLLLILWHPGKHLQWKVDQRGLELRAYAMIIFAGLFFGMSHLLYGSSWELGKVSLSSISGITLGWLYFRYGFPAAVLLHWGFNYFFGSIFFFGESYGFPHLQLFAEGLLFSVAIVFLLGVAIFVLRRSSLPTDPSKD